MLVLHCSIATYARRVGKVEPVYLTDKINKMTSKHDCLGRPRRAQFVIHFLEPILAPPETNVLQEPRPPVLCFRVEPV